MELLAHRMDYYANTLFWDFRHLSGFLRHPPGEATVWRVSGKLPLFLTSSLYNRR